MIEEEKKDMSQRLESHKLTIKAHELKAKNAQDHSSLKIVLKNIFIISSY